MRTVPAINGFGPPPARPPSGGEASETTGSFEAREASEQREAATTDPGTELVDLEGLRRAACRVRRRVLCQLPELLERFADELLALGGHVCWASTAAEARQYIVGVAARHDARRVLRWVPGAGEDRMNPLETVAGPDVTGSTIVGEVDLDQAMGDQGAEVIDTDLRTWVARLTEDLPSHLVAAVPHRDRRRVPDMLVDQACTLGSGRRRPGELVRYARERRRRQLVGAEVSVGTADLAVAETGSLVLVTDQPNTRLGTALPRVQVVVLGLDQVAAGWDQADLLLALRHHAGRPAAGSTAPGSPGSLDPSGPPAPRAWSTLVLTGPRRAFELDGPRELHVVVLDNGRSRLLGRVPPEPCERVEGTEGATGPGATNGHHPSTEPAINGRENGHVAGQVGDHVNGSRAAGRKAEP